MYGWGPCRNPASCIFEVKQTYVNLMMTCGGLVSLSMSAMMACFLGKFIFGHEIMAVSIGLVVFTATNVGNVDWGGYLPEWRFVSGYLLGAFFGSLARGPNISLLMQVIGHLPKAEYLGVLFAVGAVPRVIGPFVLVALLDIPVSFRSANFENVYEGQIPRTWLLYGSQACMFLLVLFSLLASRRAIRAHLDRTASWRLHTPLLLRRTLTEDSVDGAWPAAPCGTRDFSPTLPVD